MYAEWKRAKKRKREAGRKKKGIKLPLILSLVKLTATELAAGRQQLVSTTNNNYFS